MIGLTPWTPSLGLSNLDCKNSGGNDANPSIKIYSTHQAVFTFREGGRLNKLIRSSRPYGTDKFCEYGVQLKKKKEKAKHFKRVPKEMNKYFT